MKKVVTLVLAIALLLTSVVAIAETHATPNINTFATMKVKYDETNKIYTITLSKPVDRLLVKWAEKGAEPEELAVSEDLTATAIAWGHKYMPGVTGAGTAKASGVTWAYPVQYSETFTTWDAATAKKVEDLKAQYPGWDVKVTLPEKVYLKDPSTGSYITEKYYKTSADGKTVTITNEKVVVGIKEGTIKVTRGVQTIDKTVSTISANAGQAAFLTVQGDWAVSYNRAGKIVKIEYFEGQF